MSVRVKAWTPSVNWTSADTEGKQPSNRSAVSGGGKERRAQQEVSGRNKGAEERGHEGGNNKRSKSGRGEQHQDVGGYRGTVACLSLTPTTVSSVGEVEGFQDGFWERWRQTVLLPGPKHAAVTEHTHARSQTSVHAFPS